MPSSLKGIHRVSSAPSTFSVLIALFWLANTLWRLQAVIPSQAFRPRLKWDSKVGSILLSQLLVA